MAMSALQTDIIPVGALQVTESDEAQYIVKEVAHSSTLPKVVNDSDRKEISIDIGITKVNCCILLSPLADFFLVSLYAYLSPQLTGYVIPSNHEIGIEPSLGKNLEMVITGA